MARRRYPPLLACMKVGATQHGVISARQALNAGMSPDAVQRLVEGGSWLRVRPNVFALWKPTHEEDRWWQRLAATALWLGDAAAFSHRAAALLWDLDGVSRRILEFSTTGRRRASEPGLTIHRVPHLAGGDIVVRHRFRVTTVARTLVDMCAVAEPDAIELAFESALRKCLVTFDEIRAALDRSGRTHKGRGTLRSLMEGHPGIRTESALEARIWRLLRESRLPAPLRQHEVRTPSGRFVARVDFAYPEAQLAIEADGYRFHTRSKDWKRERARQNALVRMGWVVYRITWDDAVSGERRVAADVAALLRRSAHESGGASEV
jgi:very-short-patch-repair endonuclease